MNSQKGFVLPPIIAIIAVLVVGVGCWYYYSDFNIKEVRGVLPMNPNQVSSTTTPLVGGDKDSHGCIGSAGYSWCEVKNKCLRVWEEKCE
jgi:hypothetical protein